MPANALVDFSQFLTSVYQSRSGAIRKHLSAIIIFVHPDRNDGKLSETESRRRSRCSRRMLLSSEMQAPRCSRERSMALSRQRRSKDSRCTRRKGNCRQTCTRSAPCKRCRRLGLCMPRPPAVLACREARPQLPLLPIRP